MRVLKENKVVDAVVDYVYSLTKDDLISFEEADNFVNLLAQGEVDDADEYMVFDCANGSPLGNEDCAVKAIKSYFKESKKPSKKRIKESFDNPIDDIIMPYTNWSSLDADVMTENAKEAAEELKANGFTAEEVKAHFDEDGYYDAVNGVAEGAGTWDRAFANCILANLKESRKNKKRVKESLVWASRDIGPSNPVTEGMEEAYNAWCEKCEQLDNDLWLADASAFKEGYRENHTDGYTEDELETLAISYFDQLGPNGVSTHWDAWVAGWTAYPIHGDFTESRKSKGKGLKEHGEPNRMNPADEAKKDTILSILKDYDYDYSVENAENIADELINQGIDKWDWYDFIQLSKPRGTLPTEFREAVWKIMCEAQPPKGLKENANLDDVYYVVLSCPIQCDEFGNPEDWGAVEFFDKEYAKFEAKARELEMNEVCWDDGDGESGPIIKGAGIFYGPVEKIKDLVDEGFDIEVYENCQDEQPYELTGRIYDVNSLVYDANKLLGDEEINALDEDDIALHSIPSYKSLRESELDDLVNKPFSELVNDFLNKLVADGLLEEDVKEIFITDFKNANEPEDIDIDLLYDGVGADPHDPANQEMFAEIAKMIEDAYQFKDEWAGIDASDMIDEDDPLYGYGEEDLIESKKPTKKSIKEDRSLGRTPKPFEAVSRGTTVLEKDGEPWTVIEKGTVGELNRAHPECEIYERSYYHAVYVGDDICFYGHEDRGKHIFVYGDYDDVYNNVLAYYDDGPSRSWSVYMKESKKTPNRKTLKEDAIAKDRVGIEIKSSKGWVWASKDGLKPGAPLEYKNEKAAKSSKEWEKFLDKYGKENLRVSKANN